MAEEFGNLMETLSSKEKGALKEIYDRKTSELQELLLEELERDNEHLELVNICYNLFTKTTELNKKTGYKVVLVDPLFTLGIKIFDLMLLNRKSETAVLIEAKSSVSERKSGKIIDDTIQAARSAMSLREKLEEFTGERITSIEFVVFSFAYYAEVLKDAILSKKARICLWRYHVPPGVVQMVKLGDDVNTERLSGRMHADEKLRQTLLKGVTTPAGALRSLQIMPTSHMFLKLEYIAQQLFIELDKKPREKRFFEYSNVYNYCRQAFSSTELDDSQVEKIAKEILESATDVGLCRSINPEDEFEERDFEISYGRRNYEKFRDDYTKKRAGEKAFSAAIEEFRGKKGIKHEGECCIIERR